MVCIYVRVNVTLYIVHVALRMCFTHLLTDCYFLFIEFPGSGQAL